jgi:uncharacterized membrane protein YphA (DoxX/SURF4 family)
MENSNQKSSKALNITLWIAQSLLAAMFIMAGFTKVATPIDQLIVMMPWAADVPALLVKFIGVSELLGGLGLLLPSALRIKPNLTVLAARGLILIMIFAVAFHVSRGEFSATPASIILGSIAAFISWGRSRRAIIHSRA